MSQTTIPRHPFYPRLRYPAKMRVPKEIGDRQYRGHRTSPYQPPSRWNMDRQVCFTCGLSRKMCADAQSTLPKDFDGWGI